MSAADTPMVPEPQPKLSEMDRILNIFSAPSKTFADIKRSANWLPAWLLLFAVGFAVCYTVGQRVGWQAVFESDIKMAPAARQAQMEQMPAEQRAGAAKFTKYMYYAFPVIGLIFLTIIALVQWATFSFGVGGDVRFGQSLAIVIYASLPSVVKSLLVILILMLKVPEDFFFQNPIGTNPGYYLNVGDTPRFLFNVATGLDIFMIWTLVLTAIGFSVVGKVKQGTAYAVVFGWYAVFLLAGSALGAAFS